MKNLLLFLLLSVLVVPATLGEGENPRKSASVMPTCPADRTLRFSQIDDSDIPSQVSAAPTKCSRLILLEPAPVNCDGCTYTTSFSKGSQTLSFTSSAVNNNDGGYFPFGTGETVVTVRAFNSKGNNVNTCTYKIRLVDDEAPVLSAPPQLTVKKTNRMPDLRNVVDVDEDCDFTLTQSPAPGKSISGNPSSVLITFTAVDASGNPSEPRSLTLNLVNSTPFDNVAVSLPNVCDPRNLAATLSGLPPNGSFTISYKINGVDREGSFFSDANGGVRIDLGLDDGSGAGLKMITTIEIYSWQHGFHNSRVFVNKTATAKVGLTLSSSPTVSGVPVCAGSSLTLNFNVSCAGPTGELHALLSNASGSFASGTTDLGPVEPGSHPLLIPGSVPAGAGYRFQITVTATFLDGVDRNATSAAFRIRACDAPPGNSRLAAEASAEEPTGLQVSVSPNPTGGPLRVRMQGALGQTLKVELFNGAGQAIRQQNLEKAQAEENLNWDISRQAPGLYLLRVSSAKEAKTVKVVR
ncbi:MAG: T9SS type A sorting domain-containing protein [Cytophagaceae bacterium]|nr:T9SS type A sorting domain-containing protein [Cytophagaceae bacterium]